MLNERMALCVRRGSAPPGCRGLAITIAQRRNHLSVVRWTNTDSCAVRDVRFVPTLYRRLREQ